MGSSLLFLLLWKNPTPTSPLKAVLWTMAVINTCSLRNWTRAWEGTHPDRLIFRGRVVRNRSGMDGENTEWIPDVTWVSAYFFRWLRTHHLGFLKPTPCEPWLASPGFSYASMPLWCLNIIIFTRLCEKDTGVFWKMDNTNSIKIFRGRTK